MTDTEKTNYSIKVIFGSKDIDVTKIIEEYLLHLIERELKISC